MKKKAHLLVVDDDQYVRELVRMTLEDAGYVVTLANDGNSALARLAERSPDLVLLDIRMPDLSGYQVLQQIRDSCNVPVIMLTAVREATALELSLGLGADDYIIKPFPIQVLVARVKAKLRRVRGE